MQRDRCSKTVFHGRHDSLCARRATVTVGKQRYCTQHDPNRKKRLDDQREKDLTKLKKLNDRRDHLNDQLQTQHRELHNALLERTQNPEQRKEIANILHVMTGILEAKRDVLRQHTAELLVLEAKGYHLTMFERTGHFR